MGDGSSGGHQVPARIYTLREMMQECRKRLPRILEVLDDAINCNDPYIRLKATEMMLDRGFGKPRQQVTIHDGSVVGPAVQLYLPDNGRSLNRPGGTIDESGQELDQTGYTNEDR
jgi:hypothetical protein